MELSEKLQALLAENDISLDVEIDTTLETNWEALRERHRAATNSIFSQVQRVTSPYWSVNIDDQQLEKIQSNPAEIEKLIALVDDLKRADAELQETVTSGMIETMAEQRNAFWKQRNRLEALHRKMSNRLETQQHDSSTRLTNAFKELRERGVVCKQSGRVGSLVEGVPAIWPAESKSDFRWEFYYMGLGNDDELNAAGVAVQKTLEKWAISHTFETNIRRRLVISLYDSDSLEKPDAELVAELGRLINPEEVNA